MSSVTLETRGFRVAITGNISRASSLSVPHITSHHFRKGTNRPGRCPLHSPCFHILGAQALALAPTRAPLPIGLRQLLQLSAGLHID